MRYIGLLELYQLEKKCLGIQLQGKKIFQYFYYALLKIMQQILKISLANIKLWLFYHVFINWFKLKKR